MDELRESHSLLHLDNKSPDSEAAQQAKAPQDRPWLQSLKGISFAVLLVLAHVGNITNLQLLQRRVPDFELNVFRSGGIVLFCLVWFLFRQKVPRVSLLEIPVMLLYGFLIALDSSAINIGFALIPATLAQCAENTACLLSALLIFWFCGQEILSIAKVFSVFLCVGGVVFVLQPWHKEAAKVKISNTSAAFKYDSGDVNCTLLIKTLCHQKETTETGKWKCGIQAATNQTIEECHSVSNTTCEILNSCLFQEHGHKHKNKGKEEQNNTADAFLFLFAMPQKDVPFVGMSISGIAGLTYTLVSFVFKQYSCLNENRCMSRFILVLHFQYNY